MAGAGRWAPWACLVLVLGYAVVHWTTRVYPETVGRKLEGQARAQMDFDVYLTGARRVTEGRDMYVRSDVPDPLPCVGAETLEYIYTPLLALALTPLTTVSPCTAEWIWLALNTALCLGAAPLLLYALRLPRTPGAWALAAGLVLAPMATLETLSLGQINFIVLWLMLGAVALLDRRRPPAGGLLLGAAACLKIVPATLGVYALRRGGRQAVAWTVGAGAVLTVGAFVAAPHATLAGYLGAVNERTVGGMAQLNNASVVAGLVRAFDLQPGAVAWLSRANLALVGGVALLAAWRCPAGRVDRWLPALGFVLAAAFTPVFQVHHEVLLYPALLTLGCAALEAASHRRRWGMLAGLAAVGALLNSRGLVPLHAADNLLEHLLVKPAGLALWALAAWLLVEIVRPEAPESRCSRPSGDNG